jgi:GNAT superfamily N-acetyltransferase
MEVHPLTPARFADLATLFEQGGDPSWCWCSFFRHRNRDWTNSTAATNRAALQGLTEDRVPGLVAYEDGRAIAWTGLGPREDFDRLMHAKVLGPVDDTPVWAIVCFVVGRGSRGRGVAKGLLDAAIEYARAQGATTLEAYPVELAEGARIPSANAFAGTLAMFERAGFEVVARRQANAKTRPRPIVRLVL